MKMMKLPKALLMTLVGAYISFMFPAEAKKVIAEDTLIVDCMLPGKVKQLGTRRTYLSKKRPAKTSAHECEIRGGEYVKYDRASISSALEVWQESAMLGDAKAQYYVGEIFEKGMDQAPDFDLAMVWYKKSADQGYGPALMSLGRMYEGGMGVDKDLAKAMNLYRKASGLEGEQIEYASVFEKARLEDTQEIETLREALTQEKQTSAQLTSSLATQQTKLNNSKGKLQKLKMEVDQQKQTIAASKNSAALDSAPNTLTMGKELAEARTALSSHKLMIAALSSELEIVRAGESSNNFISTELEAAKKALQKQQSVAIEKEQEAIALQNKLAELKSSLREKSPKKQLKLVKKQLSKEKKKLSTDLVELNQQYETQQALIAELNAKLTESDQLNAEKTSAYKFELEQAQQTAEIHATASTKHQQEIQFLEQELKVLKNQTSKMAPAEQLAAVKSTLGEREKYYQNQLQLQAIEISRQENKVDILNKRLSDASNNSDDKAGYIKGLQAQLTSANSLLQDKTQAVEIKNTEVELAYAKIQTLKNNIDALPSTETLSQLEQALQAKEKMLAEEESNNQQLAESIGRLQIERDQAKDQLKKIAPEDGPVIALRWPKQEVAGAIRKAVVGAGSIVNIVGAVYPSKTISTFTINGDTEALDTNGLFLKTVEISDKPITLDISATDDAGRTSKTSLIIEPTASGQLAMTGGGELTAPKLNFGKFYALVIGNDQYNQQQGWPALKTATNDAQEIANVLKNKYGFKVSLKLNVSRDDMLIALEEMRRKLTDEDNLLVYYAGHGYMDPENDQGYWIPVDGSAESTVKWVSNATVTDQIRAMTARNVMVVADSCYSGSLMRSGIVTLRSGLSVKKKMQRLLDDIKTVTRMSLSSGGLQPVADAIGDSKHSVFANAFLKVLNENKALLDGDSLATQVGLDVAVSTQDNVKQVPRYAPLSRGGHQGGEFYFVPKDWKS